MFKKNRVTEKVSNLKGFRVASTREKNRWPSQFYPFTFGCFS